MKKLCPTALLIGLMALSACAPGTADQRPGFGPGRDDAGLRPAGPDPLVERMAPDDLETIATARFKRGYVEIGQARFKGGKDQTDEKAIDRGKALGADLVVILDPEYTGPGPGSKGPGNPSQAPHAPATPVGHHRDYAAMYFARHDFSLGVLARDPTDRERQAAGTGQGAIVQTVVDGSPAALADIRSGDLLQAVNGVPVENHWRFNDMIDQLSGQRVTLDLRRQGNPFQKIVQLAN